MRIGGASGSSGVLERTLHGAVVFVGIPAAHGVGFASGGIGLVRAIGGADVVDGVPDALSVVVAGRCLSVFVRALLAACSVGPHASGGDVATGDSGELVAVAVADIGAVVPHAFRVGIARRLIDVVHATFDDTLIAVVVLAHRVSLASSERAARSGAILEVASLATRAITRGIPHAAVVGEASGARVVEDFAALCAGVGAGIPQAGVVGGAPAFGGESCALALATRSGAPFAVIVGEACCLIADVGASLAASGVAEVPHAIRIVVALRVVGVATERAAHVARPLNVELPAAVVHGLTFRLFFKIAASVVAGADGGVPHAADVSFALGWSTVLDIALLLTLIARSAEALPFAEFVGLALGLGDGGVPLTFV